MYRSVFHVRLKDFEIQAERMLDASLRTRAMAIISSHRQNGTIVSLSDEAQQEGLQKGMKVSLARKMSHSAILMPYNNVLYGRMNRYIYHTLSAFSPLVEPGDYGQFYTDMTGMDTIYSSRKQAAHLISKKIHAKISLNSQVGISANKLVSSISTAVIPEQITEVYTGGEPEFLAPLSSQLLPTVQEKPVKRIIDFLFLHQVLNLQKILHMQDTGQLLFGQYYKRISAETYGHDTSLVKPPNYRNHIVEQKILSSDTNDESILRPVVQHLSEQVAFQLRQRSQVARSISLEIHYTDGFRNARKGSVRFNDDKTVTDVCLDLFTKVNYRRNRVRSIFIDAGKLRTVADQLNLFDNQQTENLALAAAMDRIRRKYGFSSIQPLSALNGAQAVQPLSQQPAAVLAN